MEFSYDRLRGKIVEKFASQSNFAKKMGWSERTLSLKMTGKRFWKQPEMCKAMRLLDIPCCEVNEYFFTPKVQNIEL